MSSLLRIDLAANWDFSFPNVPVAISEAMAALLPKRKPTRSPSSKPLHKPPVIFEFTGLLQFALFAGSLSGSGAPIEYLPVHLGRRRGGALISKGICRVLRVVAGICVGIGTRAGKAGLASSPHDADPFLWTHLSPTPKGLPCFELI